MSDSELERMKARLTALERILRVDAIQATGDAIDQWWQVSQNEQSSVDEIEAAGKAAAKEVLSTKNKERHQQHAQGAARREPLS